MNSPSEDQASQTPEALSPSSFFTLEEAASSLSLSPEELAYFLYEKTSSGFVGVYMQTRRSEMPVQAGFYSPSELLGAFRPQVRLLKNDIEKVRRQCLDDLEQFISTFIKRKTAPVISQQSIAATKNPLRRAIMALLLTLAR